MNRYIATAVLTLCTLPLAAQQGTGQRPDAATSRMNYLAGYLGLTEAQKTQAQTIFTAAQTASEALQGQLDSARDAARATIKANATDAEIDRLSAAVGVLQGQLLAIQTKASAKFYALLTAEQKTKYDQMGGGRMGSRGGGRFHR